jgi:hypothetical protein
MTCSALSIIFGCIAFLLFPPFFGLAGLILGIIGAVQSGGRGTAVLGIVLSILGAIIGMIIGAAMWSS